MEHPYQKGPRPGGLDIMMALPVRTIHAMKSMISL
jgi:hypothetical protein